MRKLSLVALMSLSFIMAGCKSDAESIANDMLSKLNEITAVLKGITDQNSSKAAAPKLKGLMEDLQKISKKAETAKGTKAEGQRLEEKFKKPIETAMQNMQIEMTRVASNPNLMTPELMAAMQSVAAMK